MTNKSKSLVVYAKIALVLAIFLTLSFFVNADTTYTEKQQLGTGTSLSGNMRGVGNSRFSYLRFNASDSYTISRIGIMTYVSSDTNTIEKGLFLGIYQANTSNTGIQTPAVQIGTNATAVFKITNGTYTNFTFPLLDVNIVANQVYFIVIGNNDTTACGGARCWATPSEVKPALPNDYLWSNSDINSFIWDNTPDEKFNIKLYEIQTSNITFSAAYNTSLVSGSPAKFIVSIHNDTITQANVTLHYNTTDYNMIIDTVNITDINFTVIVSTPNVLVTTAIPISFTYYVNNEVHNYNGAAQVLSPLPNLTVQAAGCSNPNYVFTFRDEVNLSLLNATIDYNFRYGLTNSTQTSSYGRISNTNYLYICGNFTGSNYWNLGYGEIFYSVNGYADRRYYLFNTSQLINGTTNNITVYSLSSLIELPFQLNIIASSGGMVYSNYYAVILRYYPNLNQYNIVDMGLTDNLGNTVIHVKTEDVDYRLAIYSTNGTLIYLANPIRYVCLANPCTYTLRISPTPTDYTSFQKIQYTFTFNQTSGIWTFIYSDPTYKTTNVNLTIYKDTGSTSYQICSSINNNFVGIVTCNTSGFTGTLRGVVTRAASPNVPLAQLIVNIFTSSFKSSWGLWLTLLVAIPIIMVGAMISPTAVIIFGVIALIPALTFGSINWGVLGGLIVLGGLVAHFLKRVSS